MTDLRQRLKSLEALLQGWGARASEVADLQKLNSALGHFDEMTVASLCSRLEAIASASGDANALPKPKKKPAIDEALVEHYVASLSDEALTYEGLDAVLKKLNADKATKAPELSAIANRLSGAIGKYNRKAALEKIESTVKRRIDTTRRLEGTDGIF